MLYEIYTWDKLRELERERRARLPGRPVRSLALPMVAPVVRLTGRVLRSAGAGLEGWGDAETEKRCCEACG
jgi:hypothetical protein